MDLKMPFGKWKGRHVDDVPLQYLRWCFENCQNNLTPNLRNAIRVALEFAPTAQNETQEEDLQVKETQL